MEHQKSRKNIYLLLTQKEKQGARLTSFDLRAYCSSHEISLLLNALAEDELKWTQPTIFKIKGNIRWADNEPQVARECLTEEVPSEQITTLNQIMDDLERSGLPASSSGFPRQVIQRLFDNDCIEVPVDDFRKWYEKTFSGLAAKAEEPHNQPSTNEEGALDDNKIELSTKVSKTKPIDFVLANLLKEYPTAKARDLWNRLVTDHNKDQSLDIMDCIASIGPKFANTDTPQPNDGRLTHKKADGNEYKSGMNFGSFQKAIGRIKGKIERDEILSED